MYPNELRQKFYNLATARTPWYKILNQSDGTTQIHIFNSIGGSGTAADDFIGELSEIVGPIELHINSEGGEVFQAKAIYNALRSRADVSVIIDGLAASAASFIAMAASPHKLYMTPIASLMIHDGFTLAAGNSSDLRRLADVLDKESNTIAGIYAERTGKEAGYFRDKMRAETWYNASEAVEEGLCDGVFDTRTGKVLNAATRPYVSDHQTRHEPMTGRHSHDHAAFGSDDHDDGQHAHMHEHHGDADHGHEHDGTEDSGGDSRSWDESEVVLASAFPEAAFYNRTFTTEQRKSLAKKGHAMKDGSYPIENCEDAKNAREAYGRAPDGKRSAVAAHIRTRESALGGCGRDSFKPGSSDNSTDFVITDEDAAAFAAAIRL